MLVTERRVGERIVIGDGAIVLEVVKVGRSRVRIGIVAPAGVPVRLAENLEEGGRPAAADGGPVG